MPRSLPGKLNPSYKGGPRPNGSGYLMSRCPSWYTGKTNGHARYVRSHILVACKVRGWTELPKGYQVHHINFNKLDNRWCNLEVLTSSDHHRVHHKHRKRDAKGRYE